METVQKIKLEIIDNGKNVREVKQSKIKSLAESIKEHGLLQPIVIQKSDDEKFKFEIVFGHSRYLAYQILAKKDNNYNQIPAIVREIGDVELNDLDKDLDLPTATAKDIKLKQIKLSENLARNAMTKEEKAIVIYETLQTTNPAFLYKINEEIPEGEKIAKEDKITLGNLAKKYGVSKSQIQQLNNYGKELAERKAMEIAKEEKAKRKAEAEANGEEWDEEEDDANNAPPKIQMEQVQRILTRAKTTLDLIPTFSKMEISNKITFEDEIDAINKQIKTLQAFIKQTKMEINEDVEVVAQKEAIAKAKNETKKENARIKKEKEDAENAKTPISTPPAPPAEPTTTKLSKKQIKERVQEYAESFSIVSLAEAEKKKLIVDFEKQLNKNNGK